MFVGIRTLVPLGGIGDINAPSHYLVLFPVALLTSGDVLAKMSRGISEKLVKVM